MCGYTKETFIPKVKVALDMSLSSLIENVTKEKCTHCGGMMTYVHEQVGFVHDYDEHLCNPIMVWCDIEDKWVIE